MALAAGRSPRGTRIRDHTPCSHGDTSTMIAALRLEGVTAPAVFDGPIDTASFRAYVDQVLERATSRRTVSTQMAPIDLWRRTVLEST